MSRLKDLTNQKFDRLTVIKRVEDYVSTSNSNNRYVQWLCKCDCGNEVFALGTSLRSGKTRSCGCLSRELVSKRSKKYNQYDLSNEYGIGYTSNTNEAFYFDLEDYDLIKNYCWYSDDGYVFTNLKDKIISLHRLVMGCKHGDGLYVDHINHDKLNCRKYNLRIVTNQQNSMNAAKRSDNTSGVTGVRFCEERNKWNAQIMFDYRAKNLGYFDTFEEAVDARKQAEEEYFGSYSYDNSMRYANEREAI